MKHTFSFLAALLLATTILAQPSADYYKSADNLKKEELKKALRLIVAKGRDVERYTSLGNVYPDIYYLYDDQKGQADARVYDLFSDEVFSFTSTSMWNKEHVIPKSWWGNSTSIDAYSDIFSVIPSLSTANSNKSNYPPGIVDKKSDKAKDSGRQWTGPATNGTGGSYSNVWEPYDDYKGDFARIVMYVATAYADIEWGSNVNVVSEFNKEEWPTMNPWLYKLMLSWHNADPVSEKEKKINNDAFDIQGNRNPFIDYPILADYIWGDYMDQTFNLSSATLYSHTVGGETGVFTVTYDANGGSDAPAAQHSQNAQVTLTTAKPYRPGYVFTSWNTRTDGRGQSYFPGQTYTLVANITLYAQWAENGENSDKLWVLVTSNDELVAGDNYVIAYSTANVIAGGLAKNGYLETVATTFSSDKKTIETLPEGAATFTLGGTSGAWTLTCDNGVLGTTAAKKLAYGSGTTTWDISYADGVPTIASTNNSYGNLQYNEGSPRFTTYTSKQKPVQLYRQIESARHFTVTTTSFNYATLYVDYPVTIPDGAEVFFATLTESKDAVLLHPIDGIIPAQTAVVVRGEATTPYTFNETDETSSAVVTGNLLVGYSSDTAITGSTDVGYYAVNYQASDGIVGFFAPKGASTPNGSFTAVAHKAYLKVEDADAAPSFSLRFDDATSINRDSEFPDYSDCSEESNASAPWYTLDGRKLNERPTRRGIYIVNGHKVIIKQ